MLIIKIIRACYILVSWDRIWFNDCSLGKLGQIPKDLHYVRVKINANNSY